MLEARIQQQLFESADLVVQAADMLSRPVAEAAEAVVGCVTAGNRVLACGRGNDADLARWFCSALALRHERDRPPLPALWLAPQQLSLLTPHPGAAGALDIDGLALQVRALGQPGDLLVAFAGMANDDPLLRAVVDEAHGKEMSVVLFTGGEPGHWPDVLGESDVWVAVASERGPRVREMHLLAVHALCDAVDLLLLGEPEPGA